jgi:UTP--glucose-1-phosphate uridylyltransferase
LAARKTLARLRLLACARRSGLESHISNAGVYRGTVKAVIPAAGLGTRLLPATKAQPKEMLPILEKPTIQYVVEEAAAAGLDEVIVVVGPGKDSIRNHFDADAKSVEAFERAGKLGAIEDLLKLVRKIPIRFVTQPEPRGLGDAIHRARHAIGDEPFAVLLGDDVLLSKTPAIGQLVRHHSKDARTVIGVQPVPASELSKYGVIDPEKESAGPMRLRGIVEKPEPGRAPSNLAVIGRYVVSPRVFELIPKTQPGKNGEIQLTDALRQLMATEPVHALRIDGMRLDVGGRFDWLRANVEIALRDPKLSVEFRAFLSQRLSEKP